MGFRLRWIAVAGATADQATNLLGFERTEQILPSPAYRMEDLPLGITLERHYLILDDARENPARLRDAALAEASQGFELLAALVYDVVSTSDVALWRDGRLVWRLTFEGDTADAKLVVTGDAPADLAEWQKVSEDGSEVPLLASSALTGFQHDQDPAGAFERLRRPVGSGAQHSPQPAPRGWFARIFGRS